MVMTKNKSEKKERVEIADTDAVYVDDDGETHLKTAELSKSGGSSDEEDE